MFTEIGKAKRMFAEMCKSWPAFNRSRVCCNSMYAQTRKASYQWRVTEENLCDCCEELLMILKTKKIYWTEWKKRLFPPNLFSTKVNMSKNTEKEVKNDLMSSNVISITVDQSTGLRNIAWLAWLLIMIK